MTSRTEKAARVVSTVRHVAAARFRCCAPEQGVIACSVPPIDKHRDADVIDVDVTDADVARGALRAVNHSVL